MFLEVCNSSVMRQGNLKESIAWNQHRSILSPLLLTHRSAPTASPPGTDGSVKGTAYYRYNSLSLSSLSLSLSLLLFLSQAKLHTHKHTHTTHAHTHTHTHTTQCVSTGRI